VCLINCDNVIIWKGIVFNIIETIKIWLTEYAVFYHCPFIVKHTDEKKHYTVIPFMLGKEMSIVGGLLLSSNLTLVQPMWMIKNMHNYHQDSSHKDLSTFLRVVY
jgi:hypothetical protein